MYRSFVLFCVLMALSAFVLGHDPAQPSLTYAGKTYALYPVILDNKPDMPSPLTTDDGEEFVVCLTKDNDYVIIPVKVENGEPLDYAHRLWYGKGRQRDVDSADFPTLAATGLHADSELIDIEAITGRPVDRITRIARPEEYSTAGFIGHDEDIVSVLLGDNNIVRQLGLTHPDLAKPLFHVFNVIISVKRDSERANIRAILYNGREIYLKFWGAKGWQESIFNDEILGYWQIEMWRDVDPKERELLSRRYPGFAPQDRSEFINSLSYIHTGEMVPFYIARYGFYEGHTDYRADPIAITFIFGLRSAEELVDIFKSRLPRAMRSHYVYRDGPAGSPSADR